MSISTVAQTVAGGLAGALEQVKYLVGNLAGRYISIVRNYPGLMQDNRAVAIATFIGVNYLVLKGSYWVAAKAEEKADNPLYERLKANGELVKHSVAILFVGSAAYAASAVLSNVADYPLTRGALLAISVFTVFARYVGKAWVESAKTHAEKHKQLEQANALKEQQKIEEQKKLDEEQRIAAEDNKEQDAINALDDSIPEKAQRQEALNKKKTDRAEAKRQEEEQARLRAETERAAKEKAEAAEAEKAAAEKKQKDVETKFKKILGDVALQTEPLSSEDKEKLEGYLALDMTKQERRPVSKGNKQDAVNQAKKKIEEAHKKLKEAVADNNEGLIDQLTRDLTEHEKEYNSAAGKLIEVMTK